MNRIIKEELEKVRVPLPYYDDNTTYIIIEGNTATDILVRINHEYIIMLHDSVLNKSSGLSSNWNRGITPKSKYLLVMVTKITGNMVLVDGCGYDIKLEESLKDSYIDLWLPKSLFKVISEL